LYNKRVAAFLSHVIFPGTFSHVFFLSHETKLSCVRVLTTYSHVMNHHMFFLFYLLFYIRVHIFFLFYIITFFKTYTFPFFLLEFILFLFPWIYTVHQIVPRNHHIVPKNHQIVPRKNIKPREIIILYQDCFSFFIFFFFCFPLFYLFPFFVFLNIFFHFSFFVFSFFLLFLFSRLRCWLFVAKSIYVA
jgi:hypothetical protein